ncbi:zeta toxin family protein [Candidatus Nomurabacteria bacterium]|nr:zeta toxin family protein [Candidatus Nomurabacteria bacterium]
MPTEEQKEWIKKNKTRLLEKYCSLDKYRREDNPVTTFMAGTPGSGKTEFSIKLLEQFQTLVVRLDPDNIRKEFPGYNGNNSNLFQASVNKIINIIYDEYLRNRQSILIDGTFAYKDWEKNIRRSIKRNREVDVYYLYQDPEIAWDFSKNVNLCQAVD